MRTRALYAALAFALFPACMVPEQAEPLIDVSVDAFTQYNFRGMPQNDEGVLQGEIALNLPGRGEDDSYDFRVWGNMDLSNDTGDAWFPNGHGTEFTEWDVMGSYSRPLGPTDVTVGVFHYGIANGAEFAGGPPAFGARGPTTEVFASVAGEVVGVVPSLTVHYDIDEVEDVYVEANALKTFRLGEKVDLDLDVNVAYAGEDTASWTYGVLEGGVADARARARVLYFHDERTTFRATVGASTIVDSEIEDWFEIVGIDSDNVWFGLGVTWGF